jgi:O-antigen ligase
VIRSRSQSGRVGLPLNPILWAALAIGLGGFAATQSLPVVMGVLGVTGVVLLAALTPLTALIGMLVLAPLRTLIATEAAVNLDIGQLALMGVIAFWLLHRIARRQSLWTLFSVWSPVYLPVLIFFVAGSLTAFNALSLTSWLSEWLKWAQILLLMALVLHLGNLEWLIFGVTLAGCANGLIGLYEFFGGSGALHLLINDRFFRAFGTFGQPNPFGGFMGLLAPVALMTGLGYSLRLWQRWRIEGKISLTLLPIIGYYGFASGVMVIGVFISWSRGAWLGFAAAAFAMAFALPRKIWQSFILLTVFIVLIGVLWFTGRLPTAIVARVNSATEEMFAFNDVRGVDITPANYAVVERLAHWQAAFNMARAQPWLGVGLGNYEDAYAQHRLINWKFPLGHAHNYYLNVLAEAGIIGFSTYVTLWLSILLLTWRARRHPDRVLRSVVIGLLGTWVYLSVHSLTDNLYVNNTFLHIGVLLGILAHIHYSIWNRYHLKSL